MSVSNQPLTSSPTLEASNRLIYEKEQAGLRKRENSAVVGETAEPRIKPSRSNTRQSSTRIEIPPVKKTFTELFTPTRKVGAAPTYWQSARAIVFASWLNVLLVCVPISFALHFAKVNPLAIFLVSFAAIIPLSKLLGFGTEEIALRVGQTLGGLLNATLGNCVEMIVAILALVKCELEIVQSSLIGSILSNILLVLGCSFLASGIRFSEVGFGSAASQVNSSLLVIAVIAFLIPSGFHVALGDSLTDAVERDDILKMSRGISVILLVIYAAYIWFTLFTHSHLFDEGDARLPAESGVRGIGSHRMFKPAVSAGHGKAARARIQAQHDQEAQEASDEREEDEEEVPALNLPSTIILLLVVTVLVGFVAEWLVDSIDAVTSEYNVSTAFVGLILLPIVGNAAEHVTAVTTAYKDKLDLAIGVAVGSSIQIALFVIPLLVVIAWGLDKPLSLLFDPFQSIVLFLSVILANYTMADSRANFLEGFVLIGVYLMIAVAIYFYPSNAVATNELLRTCT